MLWSIWPWTPTDNMDLKDYVKILTKNAFFIIALTLIGAAVAFSSTGFLKSGYKNEMVYFLVISDSGNSLTSQKLDPTNITDTAVAVLTSPDLLNETAISSMSLDVKKLAPQVIKLTLTSQSPELSKNSQAPVVEKLNQKLTAFVPEATLKLEPVGEESQSFQQVLNSKILAVFGALIGLLASLVTVAIVRYLRL